MAEAVRERESPFMLYPSPHLPLEAQRQMELARINESIRDTDEQLAEAIRENEQLTSSVEAMRVMRAQLDDELQQLQTQMASSNVDALEKAKLESNTLRKNLVEGEVAHAEETLRCFALKIQELIKQRMEKDAELENYSRRIQAMQRLINRPRGPTVMSSAVRELRQLEADNRHLQEKIFKIRAAKGDNPQLIAEEAAAKSRRKNPINTLEAIREATAKKEAQIKSALDELQVVKSKEETFAATLEERLKKATDELEVAHKKQVEELTAAFESGRHRAMLDARTEEEQNALAPQGVLQRTTAETDKARSVINTIRFGAKKHKVKAAKAKALKKAFNTAENAEMLADESSAAVVIAAPSADGAIGQRELSETVIMPTDYISQMVTERAKTAQSARTVGEQVVFFQALQDENGALQGLMNKMTAQLQETNGSVRDMVLQLEQLQARLRDETTHRDAWIRADAARVNEDLVASILAKEEEHKALLTQIGEWQAQIHTLQRTNPQLVHALTPNITHSHVSSFHQGSLAASSPLSQRGPSPRAPLPGGVHAIKQSMMLDL